MLALSVAFGGGQLGDKRSVFGCRAPKVKHGAQAPAITFEKGLRIEREAGKLGRPV